MAFGVGNQSIIQINLTDSKNGLLNGYYPASVSVIDRNNGRVFWEDHKQLYFVDGFSEIKLGPIDNFKEIQDPRVILELSNSVLEFPIYPTLLAIHSKSADQLSDKNAIFLHDGNVGFGTQTPSEKVAINGNIDMINPDGHIRFSNNQMLDGTTLANVSSLLNHHDAQIEAHAKTLSDILAGDGISIDAEQLSLLQTDILTVSQNLSESVDQIESLSNAVGNHHIVSGGQNNGALLQISNDGVISPMTDFQQPSMDHYFLRSQNNTISSTKLGDDFQIINNQLAINAVSQLRFTDTPLNDIDSIHGGIQYANGNYHMLLNGKWQPIMASNTAIPLIQLSPNEALLNSMPGDNGAIGYDGSDYYIWTNTWEALKPTIDFSGVAISPTGSAFIMLNDTDEIIQVPLATQSSLRVDETGFRINDTALTDQTLTMWKDNQFKSVQLGNGLTHTNGELSLGEPFIISNSMVGIGIVPSAELDVNGAIRLRTTSSQPSMQPNEGMIIFDGTHFKGFNGTDWQSFGSPTTVVTTTSESPWVMSGDHLITNPVGDVGIKVSNPQATLDINGSLRVRSLIDAPQHNSFLVTNGSGDIYSRSLGIADMVSNSATSLIALTDTTLVLSTKNANSNDVLAFINDEWRPTPIQATGMLELSDFTLKLSTANANEFDIMLFKNNNWQPSPFIEQGGDIVLSNAGLTIASQNASIGDIMTWNGASWVPEQPSVVNGGTSYTGANGILVQDNTIQLTSNLRWENNTFTIGSDNPYAAMRVNRLSSTLATPIKVTDSTGDIAFQVNSSGELSIGYDGAHNGYSIASNGFNLFSHSISRYQSAIGTTNVGSSEFGPTLLVHSTRYDNARPTRSVMEVISQEGNTRFLIQENGHIGVSQSTPQATLDVNGYVRLKKYTTEPVSCDLDHDGAIALNSHYKLCVCNGSSWVESNDGVTTCVW